MKLVQFDDLEWEYSEEGNFHLGWHKDLPDNKHADICYAKVDAGETLAVHYHDRPDPDGYICFYFFQGGHIRLIFPDGIDKTIKTNKPFHVMFEHMEKHGFENLSPEPVIFEIVSAPKYVDGEETRI